MTRNYRAVRGGAVLIGVGAILAAAAAPGAIAQSSGAAEARITRAVLIQANADNTEVSRATLVTQIQVDGSGEVDFKVPVVEGAAPANMDSFGGPTVENGMAVYNVSVDGTPQTFRTSQAYPTDNIPVDLKVAAKLDGKAVDLADLSGVTGDVEITYTAKNLTSTPTTLEYQDGSGQTVTEDIDLVTSMGGTIELVFPKEWSNVQSTDATVVSGDGGGNTLVSGGFTLMEPFGKPEQSFTVKATANGGSMPPATLQFTVLEPQNNPTARSIAESLKGGISTGQKIFDAGKQLGEGADQLIEGLSKATDGAGQLAAGVANTLAPGVNQLNDGVQSTLAPGVNQLNDGVQGSLQPGVAELVKQLSNLPATVTSSADFQQITGGFNTLNSAVGGVADKLGVFTNPVPTGPNDSGQYLTASGDVDKSRTTVARSLFSLIYGVRQQDVPADSPTNVPNAATAGLSNPACVNTPATAEDPTNPCGAFQIISLVQANLDKLIAGFVGTQTGQAADAFQKLGTALQCEFLHPVTDAKPPLTPGQPTGPIINGTFTKPCKNVGNNLGVAAAIILSGLTNALYKPFFPNQLDPTSGQDPGAVNALAFLKVGLQKLNTNITTNADGTPNVSIEQAGGKNTATAVLNELRANLAKGGVGSGVPGQPNVPGQCAGYNTPGDPSSGLNTSVTPEQISQTCAAADVLTLGILVSNTLQTGVSTTLLQGISNQLVAGVQPLVTGVDTLAAGTQQLADGMPTLQAGTQALADGMPTLQDGTAQLAAGLPAAVDGVGKIKTDAAGGLQQSGNDASLDFGRRVALYDAMNNPDLVSKYIPGGAPEGDNVSYNGVYKYELAGVGSQSGNTTTALALGVLGLAGAAGVGAFVASRRKGA